MPYLGSYRVKEEGPPLSALVLGFSRMGEVHRSASAEPGLYCWGAVEFSLLYFSLAFC